MFAHVIDEDDLLVAIPGVNTTGMWFAERIENYTRGFDTIVLNRLEVFYF